MNTPTLDWMPAGCSMSLLPVGKWWDAVRVPRTIALEALGRLRGGTGAVIDDSWISVYYWLVPAGGASAWEMPGASRITVLSDTAHLVVPGPQSTAGPRWHVPPTLTRLLTDPEKLHDALTRAAAVVTEQTSYEAYQALVAHYTSCPGCAHGGEQCHEDCTHATEPCALGRQLRQAWVGVRWS
ncbi:hypothetical protein OG407_20525 [Streptomyces sp. NBC_01515]|uniref:hypothetical protein n=1 Tax=Streptomyces sp. NBC_01515 TaxID=2903890 RepID=UPI003866DABA